MMAIRNKPMDKNTKSVSMSELMGMITSKEAAELSDNLSGLPAAAVSTDGKIPKVTDDVLLGLIEWCNTFHAKIEYRNIVKALKELQSLRKIDIAHTLKYAEEAAAACEEMKYGIEQVIETIQKYAGGSSSADDEMERAQRNGAGWAVGVLKSYLSKHLDYD